MHFVRSVFYWASQGCPDALPKGVIAVDLDDTADLSSDVREIGLALTSQGFFDDTCWQVGCTKEDVDLVVKTVEHPKYGQMGHTLSNDQIIPTWMFEQLKSQPGLAVSEHHYLQMECDEVPERFDPSEQDTIRSDR